MAGPYYLSPVAPSTCYRGGTWLLCCLLVFSLLVQSTHADKNDLCETGCECKHLKVTCKGLRSFPVNLPRNMMSLELRECNITEIPPGALSAFPDIREIKITHCMIDSISTCAFSKLEKVKIHIDTCIIHQIQGGAFRHLTNGVSITIMYSTIVRTHSFSFDDLRNIPVFHISHCRFGSVSPFTFNKFHGISKIQLSNNIFPILPAMTFNNINDVLMWDMELNTFSDFACNPFSHLFWNVSKANIVFNRFPCSCEVANFLQSDYPFPKAIQIAFIRENMCYQENDDPELFMNVLVQEKKGCITLRQAICDEESRSSLEVLCLKSSFKRTDKLSSMIPQATIQPGLPTTRDPNSLYTDEMEPPYYHNPTTKSDGKTTSNGEGRHTNTNEEKNRGTEETASGREGSASGDRETSSDGAAYESRNKTYGFFDKGKKHSKKDEVDVAISQVTDKRKNSKRDKVTEQSVADENGDSASSVMSSSTVKMTKFGRSKESVADEADSISGRVGSGVTQVTKGKSTKSTSLQIQNRSTKSGQSALAHTSLLVVPVLLAIYRATKDL